nr:hypothetical protein [Candidatus Sigynarchaeota archaeon]
MGSVVEQGVLIAVAIGILLIIIGVIVQILGWFQGVFTEFWSNTDFTTEPRMILGLVLGLIVP